MNNFCIVYYSSQSENTKRFVSRLNLDCSVYRIPIAIEETMEELHIDKKYVLIVPSYGGGAIKGSVPKEVINFLNNPENRKKCVGVISSGNINFGPAFAISGKIIKAKLAKVGIEVDVLHKFELLGTEEDVAIVRQILVEKSKSV